MTTGAGDREYTITPALVDAVGRRETNDDIDTYIDRHGVTGLVTALIYTVARERGEVTHRLVAADRERLEGVYGVGEKTAQAVLERVRE